jgi:HSP20 family molecular chaperone IbpA
VKKTVLAPQEEDDPIMTRVSVFSSPLLLGFDHFERVLDRVSKTSAEGYPPYNIEQIGEDRLRITLAVAGFTSDDLSVSIEDNQLVVRGRQGEEDPNRTFIYRGIAARQFQRSFVLAEGIEVNGANLDSGLLHIDLRRPLPENRVRSIPIGTAGARPGKAIDLEPGAAKKGER